MSTANAKLMKSVNKLKLLKFKKEEIEAQIKEIEDELKTAIGDEEVMLYKGVQIYSYKTIQSSRFDSSAFKDEMPQLYASFLRPTTYRRLTLR